MNTADAQDMAIELMHMHGVMAPVIWTNDMWRNGEAFVSRDGLHDELRLSVELTSVRGVDDVRNTILHEIAHLTSRDHTHGDAFIAKARELGVKPNEGSKSLVMALAAKAKR